MSANSESVFVRQIGVETAKRFLGWKRKALQHILNTKTCVMELPVTC